MRDLRPDYKKCRVIYFIFSCVLNMVAFIVDIGVYTILNNNGQLEPGSASYVFNNIIIPTLINAGIITVSYIIRKVLPENDMLLDSNAVITIVLICFVQSYSHNMFTAVMLMYCLPIFMSVQFGKKPLVAATALLSMVGIAISMIARYYSADYTSSGISIAEEAIIVYFIILCAYFISNMVVNMMLGQMRKLISVVKEVSIAQQREAAANKAKSEFLAHMSHEIRTPLNAIIGMNEMISRESSEASIKEYAYSVNSASTTLLAIINDILDFSKIENGKIEVLPVDYDLAGLINSSYNMLAEKIQSKNLKGIIECDPALPKRLNGDELRIRQVFVNLLSNAAKYTNEGTVKFSINGETEGDTLMLRVSVKDTGIGIKEEDLPNLFFDFTRLDSEHTRTIQGTGLGLAISKQLVTIMNGTITVNSVYGEGSEFVVTIPQKIIDDTPIGTFSDAVVSDELLTGDRQLIEAPEARILVVDDVVINLKVIKNLLKETKINIDTVQSGAQCLVMAQKTKYDIIFMDHMMPKMDGIQTLHAMNAMPNHANKDTPVIMLTANAISGVEEEYFKEGFADYLSKPIIGGRLEEMLIKYLPEEKVKRVG